MGRGESSPGSGGREAGGEVWRLRQTGQTETELKLPTNCPAGVDHRQGRDQARRLVLRHLLLLLWILVRQLPCLLPARLQEVLPLLSLLWVRKNQTRWSGFSSQTLFQSSSRCGGAFALLCSHPASFCRHHPRHRTFFHCIL